MLPGIPSKARARTMSDDRSHGRRVRRPPFLTGLSILLVCVLLSACAVQQKREAITYDSIPTDDAPSAADIAYGKRMLRYMLEDFPGSVDGKHQAQLDETFTQLAEASGLDPEEWHVQLLYAPYLADVRAVEGNYLFVWSGLFDVVDSEDELAGLLACEMAHLLAGHAEPIRFTPASELLFGLTDMALTLGMGMLSQGALNLNGAGISRSIFVDVNDLDVVHRVYTPAQLEEMAPIAALMLEASQYSPQGLLDFWRRAPTPDSAPEGLRKLIREVPPNERLAILEAAVYEVGIASDEDPAYPDEPVQTGGTDKPNPDLGSNESGADALPGTSG